jgi:RNA polymerase sigma-70 factor (ECF subfamily)
LGFTSGTAVPTADDKYGGSDDELARLVASAGDRRAFGVLTQRHHAAVRSTLMRLTRNPAIADDLAQETFIRAFLRIDQYTVGRSFRAWLGGIAYREFLKDRRKQMRAVQHARQHNDDPARDVASFNPERIDLDRALATLRPEERTAVILCYASGMSHAEVSEAMAAPLGTVKSWVNRGRDKLKTALKEPTEKYDSE